VADALVNTALTLLPMLARQCLAISLAALVVWAVRPLFVRHLGARAAYLAWLSVPLAALAVLLPSGAQAPGLVAPVWVDWIRAPASSLAAQLPAPPAGNWATALAGLWLFGMACTAALLWQRQSRYVATLTRHPAPLPWRSPPGTSPAQVGLWHVQLVLPADFEQRFDGPEQALVLVHEARHGAQCDNAWNLLAAVLCCLHWFNPLPWLAWRFMRQDQEHACDAAVLQGNAAALPIYARALLKSQALVPCPVLSSAWRSSHPLVERIRMLKHHTTLAPRRHIGAAVAALVAVVCAGAVYAAQADGSAPVQPPGMFADLRLTLSVGGRPVATPRLIAALGERAMIRMGPSSSQPELPSWQIELTTTQLADGRLQVVSNLSAGTPPQRFGPQTLVTQPGEVFRWQADAAAGTQPLALELTARLVPKPVP
jgi:beta-lactamase regulating signal transducer with metallopeptidase domain